MQYDLTATKSIISDKFKDIFVAVFDRIQKQSIKPGNQRQPPQSSNNLYSHPSKTASSKTDATDIKKLREVVQNKALFQKIAAIIQEILLWIYAYYQTYQNMRQQGGKACEIVQEMINIHAKYTSGELKSYYYMELITRRNMYGWRMNFCKTFLKYRNELQKYPQIDQYININDIMHEYVNMRQNILDQCQQKSNHLQSLISQSFHKEEEPVQLGPLGKVRENTYRRNKQRTTRMINYIRNLSQKKVFLIKTNHEQAIAEEVVIYLDIFMSKVIKQVLQCAFLCNEKLNSESVGNQLRYLSKEGFKANKFYEKTIKSMEICPQSYQFKRVIYPSQLEQHNNLMMAEFEAEKKYFDLIFEKQDEKQTSTNQKKLMKNYFYKWNDQVQPPSLKKERLPLKSKRRIVISSKILQRVLSSAKYQWSFASQLSLFNCM